jgi:hypothetical protein
MVDPPLVGATYGPRRHIEPRHVQNRVAPIAGPPTSRVGMPVAAIVLPYTLAPCRH